MLRLILSRLLILPVALFAGNAGTPEAIQAVRADLGLDRPLAMSPV